jgi:hypothetical protein
VYAENTDHEYAILALLNGKIELAYWIAIGDDFDVTNWMFADLPIDITQFEESTLASLKDVARELKEAMESATTFKLNAGKKVGNYNLAMCRSTTDKSDRLILSAIGAPLMMEELNLLYSQVVRTKFPTNEDD